MVDIYNQFNEFKSFEAAFVNEDNQRQKIFCSIKNIANDKIIIEANKEKNDNIIAKEGDELKIHIYTDNGIYSATSRVLLVSDGLINTEYIIAYPNDSKHSQRREYFRADMPVDFRLSIYDDNHEHIVSTIEAKTKNICGKGMCYISDKPFPQYNSLDIELFFKEKNVISAALLVYSKQILVANKSKYIHAFTFTNISKQNIDFIVKKCFLYQLELRKKQNSLI